MSRHYQKHDYTHDYTMLPAMKVDKTIKPRLPWEKLPSKFYKVPL